MSRMVLPIAAQVLWSTGDLRLWADISLAFKDDAGNFIPDVVRIDTGTEITTFPAYEARLLNLPMPLGVSPGIKHMPTGLEIRSGVLRFQMIGMDQTEYAVPCLFLGDPWAAPAPGQPALAPRKLFQPLAVLDLLRFTLEKDAASGSLYGDIVVEKK